MQRVVEYMSQNLCERTSVECQPEIVSNVGVREGARAPSNTASFRVCSDSAIAGAVCRISLRASRAHSSLMLGAGRASTVDSRCGVKTRRGQWSGESRSQPAEACIYQATNSIRYPHSVVFTHRSRPCILIQWPAVRPSESLRSRHISNELEPRPSWANDMSDWGRDIESCGGGKHKHKWGWKRDDGRTT